MIGSNLSTTDQFGFKQPPYTKPKSQGAIIGCNPLSLVGSEAKLNFVDEHPFVKALLQISPCEPINTENFLNDTNQKLGHIFSGKQVLRLKKPFDLTIVFRDDTWTMENKDFGIISMSTDYKECLKDFNEEVYFIYEEYGQEEDNKLTSDAKILKRKILQYTE